MFIKKDLRKIPQILADAAPVVDNDEDVDDPDRASNKRTKREVLTELRLSRRQAEFNGSVNILCQPQNAPSLKHLISLSLYDCKIHSLDGIGMLASPTVGDDAEKSVCCPSLRELNVGRSPITTLPEDLAKLSPSLEELWCDDCQIEGPLPACILNLENLKTLRVSNNKLTSIPSDIHKLENLETLCLDRNEIGSVPTELSELTNLKSLMLRGNKLLFLPEGVPGSSMTSLSLLHVSSNQLMALPDSVKECTSLEVIYANSNHLDRIPSGMVDSLQFLQKLTLSHNRIQSLPLDFVERFGEPDPDTGECNKDDTCVVSLAQNPIMDQYKRPSPRKDKTGADLGNAMTEVSAS